MNLFTVSKAKPLVVEIVGEDGKAFHVFLALGGSLLVATAAVVAAIVAARTANKRQAAQLAHDFEVRQREHIRDALDKAVEEDYAAFEALTMYEVRIKELESARGSAEKLRREEAASEAIETAESEASRLVEETAEIRTDLAKQLLGVQAAEFRLALRVGRKHDITEAHQKLKVAFADSARALDVGREKTRITDELDAFTALDEDCLAAYEAFNDTCEAWIAGS